MKMFSRRPPLLLIAIAPWLATASAAPDDTNSEIAELRRALAAANARIAELEAKAEPVSDASLEGLDSPDPATGREAITLWRDKGEAALPKLREIAFKSASPTARHRAKEAIGGITGQWGSHTDLVWKRSTRSSAEPTAASREP